MYVLSAAQARAADRITIERLGIPSERLMERAASAVARYLYERHPDTLAGRIGIVCGPGNNGGDGRVLARLLQAAQVDVQVATAEEWTAAPDRLLACALVVDGLFGTGLSRPITGAAAAVIKRLNRDFHGPVIAIDLPSGLGTDSPVVRATATITFTAPKLEHLLAAGAERCGLIRVAQIGTPVSVLAELGVKVRLADAELCAPYLAPRAREGHKGRYGHVAVIGGGVGKSGAVVMAGTAALRSGAGLVTVAAPAAVQPEIAVARAELMSEPWPELGATSTVLDSATVLAIGPGAGQAAATGERLRAWARGARVPCVLDADGLNAFAGRRGELRLGAGGVLTPHPGEMGRLFGVTAAEVQSQRIEYAQRLAAETGAIAVLKGHRTLIAAPDGDVFINTSGNPGMATGGSGDVLTGIVAGLIAQFPDRPLLETAAAAVYLHGRAGDAAAEAEGEIGLIAGDILAWLPRTLLQVQTEGKAERRGDPVDIPA